MDPNEIYDAPGKSKMGMDLVPVYEEEGSSSGVVTIDGSIQQTINLQTTQIEKKNITTNLVTNGILMVDERKEYIINTKVSGWIENLYVNYTGQKVNKGEKLVDIYSPDLVAAQQELLTALSYQSATSSSTDYDILNSGNELVENAITKLELFDIPNYDIKKLSNTRKINKYMTIYSPINGTVLMKNALDGDKINAGQKILHIADLSNLWLLADVYEYELYNIELGAQAEVNFNAFPGKTFKGVVSFIYPTVDNKTRTIKVRIDIPNVNGLLKPSMYGEIIIKGKDFGEFPVIDETAVIRSGKKNIAILALGDGKFKPIELQLGKYANGFYQILSGLNVGDKVVISAQFLIDSESSLKAVVQKFSSSTKDEETETNKAGHDYSLRKEMGDSPDKQVEQNEIDEHSQIDDKETEAEESIIRKGIIDLHAIDKNNDGKVFQDFMDWNVISDEPGRCPICEMKLQEVSLSKARENLVTNGFKVK